MPKENTVALTPMEPITIAVEDAALLLGVSRDTIYKLLHRDDFPRLKIGNRTLISVAGLRRWVEAQIETGREAPVC